MEVRGNTILVKGSGTVFAGTKTTEKELGRFENPAGNFPTGKIDFRVDGSEEFEITSLIIARTPSRSQDEGPPWIFTADKASLQKSATSDWQLPSQTACLLINRRATGSTPIRPSFAMMLLR